MRLRKHAGGSDGQGAAPLLLSSACSCEDLFKFFTAAMLLAGAGGHTPAQHAGGDDGQDAAAALLRAGGKDANGETVVRISGAGEEPDFTATAQRTASGVLLMTLGFELMLIACERWHRCTGRLSTAPVRHLASDFFQGLAA